MYKYKGFKLIERFVRNYPGNCGAHLLGYVREVDRNILSKKPYYQPRDLIGISGLEKQYETYLRGIRGENQYLKDAHGNLQEILVENSGQSGRDLTSTIDLKLQQYGERLMQNKIGSIVAIEPNTGEILALISAPSFNPNKLTGDSMSFHWRELALNDSTNPLFNRALLSKYSPGSIFKMVQGLTAWEKGVIDQNTKIYCDKNIVGCHNHKKVQSLADALKYSCNPYFYETFKRISTSQEGEDIHIKSKIGLTDWSKYVKSFGLGMDLKMDFPTYSIGNIPDSNVYNKMYKGIMNWNYRTCNTLSIGQGEMQITPYQMANLACVMANRGHYYYPHFVKNIKGERMHIRYKTKQHTKINPNKFEYIVNAMQQVIEGEGGTARRAKIDGITVCGKTGTVENSHGEDHSVFIAFAPRENPKIAIAVFIENGGYGGYWSAPISSLMIEKYLTDSISNNRKEKRILDANLIPKNEK